MPNPVTDSEALSRAAKVGDVWWRADIYIDPDFSFFGSPKAKYRFEKYTVTYVTPNSVFLASGGYQLFGGPNYAPDRSKYDRVVRHTWVKKIAQPTKQLAVESLQARLLRAKAIFTARLQQTDDKLAVLKNLMTDPESL